jgi:hypothetical protein
LPERARPIERLHVSCSLRLLGAEALDLLGLDKREVLSGALADSEVPVADDAHSPAKRCPLTLVLCRATRRTDDDALNDHPSLRTPDVRAEWAPAAGRQARAGENAPRTGRPGLMACRWRSG